MLYSETLMAKDTRQKQSLGHLRNRGEIRYVPIDWNLIVEIPYIMRY